MIRSKQSHEGEKDGSVSAANSKMSTLRGHGGGANFHNAADRSLRRAAVDKKWGAETTNGGAVTANDRKKYKQ